MAVLFGNELFRCSCGSAEFEEVVIKSYNIKDTMKLKENSASYSIKCTNCSKKYPIDNMTGYSIVQ